MSTSVILGILQTLNATVTGVTSAPTDFPSVLNPSDMPMALSYPEGANYERYAVEGHSERRTWYVRLYVQPITHGAGVDEGFSNTIGFIDLFRNVYRLTAYQKGTDWWSEMQLISDSGVRADMRLHNAPDAPQHWGVEFQVLIIIHHDVDA